MLSVKCERLADILPELIPIFPGHWQELALNKDQVPLDPQYDVYLEREERDELLSVIMRDDQGTIAGYFFGFIAPGLHYQTCLTCTMDIFYIRDEYRSGTAAIRLFRFVERELKTRGVDRWFVGSKCHSDLSRMFEALKFDKVEVYYSKYLGEI